MLNTLLAAVASAALAAPAMNDPAADTVAAWRDLETDDATLRYLVVRPADDLDAPRPTLLAFPPGTQDAAMVDRGIELYWQALAEDGWIVVSPQAPASGLFFGDGADAIGPLLDAIHETLPVAGRVHVAGPSNGGRSAFRAAFDHTARVASLTVLPGFPEDEDLAVPHRLAGMPLAMYVGGADRDWFERMEAAADTLTAAGAELAIMRTFPGEGHVPESLTGELLAERLGGFAQLDANRTELVTEIEAVLDDFHLAASEADFERYFGHFTGDGVFVGTDATERWSVSEFQAYAAPVFATGSGWTYTAIERHVTLSPTGEVAWFDERLHNAKYGETRGSGVLVRRGGRWRISQYVLSIPVPNDLAGDLVERIAEHLEESDG